MWNKIDCIERRILEEVRPLGSRRSIYYGHVPPARDRQPSEGCLRAPLRASRGVRNNIPYSDGRVLIQMQTTQIHVIF